MNREDPMISCVRRRKRLFEVLNEKEGVLSGKTPLGLFYAGKSSRGSSKLEPMTISVQRAQEENLLKVFDRDMIFSASF